MAPEIGVIKTQPEPYKALYAIETAKEVLQGAEKRLENDEYAAAYEEALSSMRLASSAVMFFDGCVIQTLEGAAAYLKHKYSELPADEWKAVEYGDPYGKGIAGWLSEALGLVKRNEKAEAAKAVAIARIFVSSVESLLIRGGQPLLEISEKFE